MRKFVATATVAAMLSAAYPAVTVAQDAQAPAVTTAPATGTVTTTADDDDGFDWGWLGLLGLLGLAGLRGRRNTIDHSTTRPGTTTTR